MKKILIILLLLTGYYAQADEGMWLPLLIERLNYIDMQKEGLKLTADEIYSINHSSIKDAIVQFDNGCTGEIISSSGLLLTNHHCGYGQIQSHSTLDHDYLTDGFWAYNKGEELQNEGLTVRFLVRIEDVTNTILSGLNDKISEMERNLKIQELSKTIIKDATTGTHYEGRVASFFNNNEFYLFIYEVFKDVRLVGAPPSSIGRFGADTDNWMWPRHKGDFTIFRVYSAPDGTPAEYSLNNVPLTPKHHLPISLKGVNKDDFTMILGYPGTTDRYLTSWGVEMALNVTNPAIVKIRREKLDIMRQDMDSDKEVNIKYASKYARTSNYWKYYLGQTKGLKKLHVVDKKQKIEHAFNVWINKLTERQNIYSATLDDIKNAYNILQQYELQRVYFNEAIFRGAEIFSFANTFYNLVSKMENKEIDEAKKTEIRTKLIKYSDNFFKDYNLNTDLKLLSKCLNLYYNNVEINQQAEYFIKLANKNSNDFDKIAATIFKKTIFAYKDKVDDFINNPSLKQITKDPAYKLINDFINKYKENNSKTNVANENLQRAKRLFIAGLREMNPYKKYYPDANSTMRLTYGKVLDYYPANAVHYDYITYGEGILEKEDPNNWEFVVPDKLNQLIKSKDFGKYGQGDRLPVCFISTNDITGGNSGSPVLNAYGHLIGIAFDGNWEAMSGDIAFEPELQRTVNVDIRYMLFIIDKFAGAKNIIDELTFAK